MILTRARLVCPALRWRRGSFRSERAKIEQALAAGVGGFILFGGTRAAVTALTSALRELAGRPLLIGSDFERGPGQQVKGLTELPPPAALGYLNDLDATYACGQIAGTEARAVGLNWIFAPVCDLDIEPKNPIVQTRSFGVDPEGEAAAAAIAAGCDMLLYPTDWAGVVRSLERVPADRAEAALARYQDALSKWGHGEGGILDDAMLAEHQKFADGLADRALHLVRGEKPHLGTSISVATVDDDVGGPYAIPPRDVFQKTLQDLGVRTTRYSTADSRERIVLVYAEPRSWKGRGDLGSQSVARLERLVPGAALVVLFAHPRLAAQVPGDVAVLCAWHGQALMQRAAARWVLARR